MLGLVIAFNKKKKFVYGIKQKILWIFLIIVVHFTWFH